MCLLPSPDVPFVRSALPREEGLAGLEGGGRETTTGEGAEGGVAAAETT